MIFDWQYKYYDKQYKYYQNSIEIFILERQYNQ